MSRLYCFVFVVGLLFVPNAAMWGQVRESGPVPESRSPSSAGAALENEDGAPGQSSVGAARNRDQAENDPPTSTLGSLAANISGTVSDVNGDLVPGANIVLEGPAPSDRRTSIANENGAFHFDGLKPGIPYQLFVTAAGFQDWRSPALVLNAGQFYLLQDVRLKLPVMVASVTVSAKPVEIATEQVTLQEHQRVFGIFPNFYVTYDRAPVPLTTKLKFRLAAKAYTDPVNFLGIGFMAALYQAGDMLDYGQGWDAYGKRFAAGLGDTATDIFIGGAILPWMLHQDPRYFYQGTGTKKSRARHAMFSPFVCRGDNGKVQPNFSSLGGDLASGAISNLYYPESNRGASLVLEGFLITTGARMANGLVQEFLLRKFTPSARHRGD